MVISASMEEGIFKGAFHFAAIGMALVALDGRWMRVNRALCEVVGYSEDELRTRTFQDLTYPDDLETDLAYVAQLLRGEIPAYRMEKRYIHKDGRLVWALLDVSLVRGPRGEPEFFISQVRDITARKQAMAEKDRLLAELIASNEEIAELRAGLLTVCPWTKRIRHDGKWISVDEFLGKYPRLNLTHGISEEALEKALEEESARKAGGPAVS